MAHDGNLEWQVPNNIRDALLGGKIQQSCNGYCWLGNILMAGNKEVSTIIVVFSYSGSNNCIAHCCQPEVVLIQVHTLPWEPSPLEHYLTT